MNSDQLFVVIDNRLLPQASFLQEASFNSFQKLTCELVCKLLYKATNHAWLAPPKQLLFAASASLSTSSAFTVQDIPAIPSRLEPRYTTNDGLLSALKTWKIFFNDALKKVKLMCEQSMLGGVKVSIVFYSTDTSMFGAEGSISILDGLHTFLETVQQLKNLVPSLTMRFVAGLMNSSDPKIGNNQLKFLSDLTHFSWITFDTIFLTHIQFDEELKLLMSSMAPRVTSKLLLPLQDDSECFVFLQLIAHSLAGADCLMHLKNLEVRGACSREKINPLHLSGYGVEVSYPTTISDDLPQHALETNYTLSRGLLLWMAEHDTILIIRVPFTPVGQTASCAKNWALIPPAAKSTTASDSMVLIMLLDRDQMLMPPTVEGNTESAWSLNEDLLEELRMGLDESSLVVQNKRRENQSYNPWLYLGGWGDYEFNQFRQRQSRHSAPEPYTAQQQPQQQVQSRSVPVVLPSPIVAPKDKATSKKQIPNVIDLVVSESSSSSNAGKKAVGGSGGRTPQTRSSAAANTTSSSKKGPGVGNKEVSNLKGKISVAHQDDDDDEWIPDDFNPVPKGEPKLLKRKFSEIGRGNKVMK